MVGICFLFAIVGFLIYGRKLAKLMPYEYFKKINKVSFNSAKTNIKFTRRVTLVSAAVGISGISIFIVAACSLQLATTPDSSITIAFIVNTCIAFRCFASYAVFARFSRKFPFVFHTASEETETTSIQLSATV
jgi:hypothetical protein